MNDIREGRLTVNGRPPRPALDRFLEHTLKQDSPCRSGKVFTANRPACVHGHPFDEDNIYRTKRGHRVCRECKKRYSRERRRRLKEAA